MKTDVCPCCAAPVLPLDARCARCAQVLGPDNRCPHCQALAETVARDGQLRCSACDGDRTRAPRTVVVSEQELGQRPLRLRVASQALGPLAALLALLGVGSGGLLALYGANSFEHVIGVALIVIAILIAGGLVRSARKARALLAARERFALQQRLLGIAAQKQGVVTAQVVSTALNLPLPEADAMLVSLVRDGRADMDVTERGELRYVVAQKRIAN